jgi:hypothetical protein
MKLSKKAKKLLSEAKRSKTKKFWKRNKAKIRSVHFALIGSEKLEAK